MRSTYKILLDVVGGVQKFRVTTDRAEARRWYADGYLIQDNMGYAVAF